MTQLLSPAPSARERGTAAKPADATNTVLLAATIVFLLAASLCVYTAILLVSAAKPGLWTAVLAAVALLLILLGLATAIPLVRGYRAARAGAAALASGDVVSGRRLRFRGANSAWITLGSSLPVSIVSVFVLFLLANNHAVQSTFFDVSFMAKSLGAVSKAFTVNIIIAVIAEVFVLVFGLVIAIARMAPGQAGRPIRWLATTYVDVFRAVPSIIVIYLVGFGLPLANVPILSGMSPMWAAIFALTLTYSAYVAEVYRAGISSIHWSQVSAARSLGLSHGKTLRFVIIPQAFRRVSPPLLNDFIGLQKDTALVTIIGTVDAFTQAKTYASNYFNLSSVTVVAILFILITIPQTRFVDRLLERDEKKQRLQG
ncbi:amino acid ABC transporter permease [Specibacter cremeus]|uniref:amino acid ABC transporter permease n=1 Tax=Specibacter cremeus TaxID=1629051 RepID=UPI00197CA513|nr:amino acid ABC transporter permease [Specibacter cremeus]